MSEFKRTYNVSFNRMYKFALEEFANISVSTSVETVDAIEINGVSVALLVFERFSYSGSNRVSLTAMIVGNDTSSRITLVSSGGSQGLFFKINKIGENSFLNKAVDLLNESFGSGNKV